MVEATKTIFSMVMIVDVCLSKRSTVDPTMCMKWVQDVAKRVNLDVHDGEAQHGAASVNEGQVEEG